MSDYPHTTVGYVDGGVRCSCGATWTKACHFGPPPGKTWGHDCPAAMAERIAELEATLANERGEGEPPEPGWRATSTTSWSHGVGGQPGYASVSRASVRCGDLPWYAYACGRETPHPTARAAMRAATQALRSSHV